MAIKNYDSYDINEVRQAAKGLTMQASIFANRHINNGQYRAQLTKDVDRWGQCLVDDFSHGRKTKTKVIATIQIEKQNLLDQASIRVSKGIGLIVGVMMVGGGLFTCYASAMTACALAAPMIAHGANNIYENGKYFYDGDENATGLVRKGYQEIAELTTGCKSYGDIGYYSVDLLLSARGLMGRSNKVKFRKSKDQIGDMQHIKPQFYQSWAKTPKARQFKLFRYMTEDYLRGYQAMHKASLSLEVVSDGVTLNSLWIEMNNGCHK